MQQSDGRRSAPAVGASKARGFASQWDDEFFPTTFCHRVKKERKKDREREIGKERERDAMLCRKRERAAISAVLTPSTGVNCETRGKQYNRRS